MNVREFTTNAADRLPSGMASSLKSDSRAARVLRPLVNRLLPRGETMVTVRSGSGQGLKLLVDPQSEKYYWTGGHETHVQEAIDKVLEPGMCLWDVGAHIGFFAAIAARLVGDSGSVVAFEPMPETRVRLQRTVIENGFTNITLCSSAVSDSNGTRTLRPPLQKVRGHKHLENSEFTAMWTLVDGMGVEGGVEVECQTLDSLAESFPAPDLLKIDAEGAELDVLTGGMGLLSRGATKVIIEMSDEETLERGRTLLPDFDFEHIGNNHWLIG